MDTTADRRGRPSHADTGTMDGQDNLAASFSQFARSVQQQADPEETLAEIVRAAVALIPGCDDGSISVVAGRRAVNSHAPLSEFARVIDTLQDSLGQGPCLDAAYDHETVRVADMAAETRWPRFIEAARAAGAAGMLSIQLFVDGDNLGALNLFSRTPGAFDDESEHVGLMFAAHAAVAFAATQQQAAMNRAVATRQLIGQAQGVLMERHKLTSDQAFALLVRVSQHRKTELRDIAASLVQSGRFAMPE